jgi:hypothetical protein
VDLWDGKLLGSGKYRVRRARVADSETVLLDIREKDKAEWDASVPGGLALLADCINSSAECWSVIDDATGRAHIIWGVVPRYDYCDTTWLLGTNEGQAQCAWIFQECRELTTAFFRRWPYTECWSDERNTVHHQWLEWLGYGLHRHHVILGPQGLPFRHYRKEP